MISYVRIPAYQPVSVYIFCFFAAAHVGSASGTHAHSDMRSGAEAAHGREQGVHVLVTNGELVPTVAKLVLFDLYQVL